MTADAPLLELCRLLGVETEYVDNTGLRREPPRTTLVALLAVLGYPAAVPEEVDASIERFRRQRVERLVEPVTVCRDDEQCPSVVVTQAASTGEKPVRWTCRPESSGASRGECRFDDLPLVESVVVGGRTFERRRLTLPTSLPLGYHRARIEAGGAEAESTLIVVPRRAYQPPALDSGRGLWGLAIQLYGLRSRRNWGIGDLTDLGDFLRAAAAAGASVVSINPLHALFPDDPQAASPYSPSSRLFSNPLYLDVEAIDDFAECAAAQASSATADWQAMLQRLRAGELIDYAQVTERKLLVLDQLYRSFRSNHLAVDDERARAFRAFQAREGAALNRFATYHALREAVAKVQGHRQSWREWPAELRDPASPAVARFAKENRERVELFAYLQWQMERQLAGCAETVRQIDMPIGLLRDLAVGVDADGAEAWANQKAIVSGWSIGAPPDAWNPNGQSWGLPPFQPVALRALAYRPLIETLRANMRHAGALRVDHILGFRRLFWIPAGGSPADGAYVRYPFEDMVGILALESHRNRCLAIGEDLGTVPEGLREALADRGVFSYRLLYFERGPDGGFRRPEAYPRQALVAVGTHDLPPFPAYWAASDLALKHRLGIYRSVEHCRQDEDQRGRDRQFLIDALRQASLLEQADPTAEGTPPVEAVYRFLARTPCRLLMIHLEDALGLRDQINLPGTVFEHPNWRRRLPLAVDDLFRHPSVCRLLRALAEERPAAARLAR